MNGSALLHLCPDVHSDSSGICFAGVVNVPGGITKVTAREFDEYMLHFHKQENATELMATSLTQP